jgi:hypothetical protein
MLIDVSKAEERLDRKERDRAQEENEVSTRNAIRQLRATITNASLIDNLSKMVLTLEDDPITQVDSVPLG